MRRILVTGASGFIGRQTLEPLLQRGFEVHAVARRVAQSPAPDGVHRHSCDVLDDAARSAVVDRIRPSHLLHLAWYAEPGAFWEARENAHWTAATILLLEDFAAAGGRRAVLAGSCAEYRWGGREPLTEDAPLAPATLYGVCKDATRTAAEELGRLRGLEIAWGRIFFLYGPGEDERRLVASVARALTAGERAPTSAGEQVRDFLHVRDVAGAFAALTDAQVAGPVNIASGDGVPVRCVVEMIAAAAGRPELLDVGVLPPRPGDPERIVADVTRLREAVGFTPTTSLEAGIAETVRWWASR